MSVSISINSARAAALLKTLDGRSEPELVWLRQEIETKQAQTSDLKLHAVSGGYRTADDLWVIKKVSGGKWAVRPAPADKASFGIPFFTELLVDAGLFDREFERLRDARAALEAFLFVLESEIPDPLDRVEVSPAGRRIGAAYQTDDGLFWLMHDNRGWTLASQNGYGSEKMLVIWGMKGRFWPSLEALRRDLDIMYWRHDEQEAWMPMTTFGTFSIEGSSGMSRRVVYDPYLCSWHVEGKVEKFRSRKQIRELFIGSSS